jgi:hypothetical protein
MKRVCRVLMLNRLSAAAMAAVVMYEPFEGAVSTGFIESGGGGSPLTARMFLNK